MVVGGMGDGARFIAVVLEASLGLRQRQKRGEHVPAQRLSCPPLETLSGFQGAGAQATTSDRRGLCSCTSAGAAEARAAWF